MSRSLRTQYPSAVISPTLELPETWVAALTTDNCEEFENLLKTDCLASELDEFYRRSILWAAAYGSVAILEFLLQNTSVHLDSLVVDGRTALNWAIYHDKADVAQVLLRAGASAELEDTNGYSSLMNAVRLGSYASLSALVSAGVNVDAQSRHDMTPLMLAARAGDATSVKLLLDASASVSAKTTDGIPAVALAAAAGHKEVMEILLANANQESLPVLKSVARLQAVLKDTGSQADFLLGLRARDLQLPVEGGKTLLTWAASKNDRPCMRLLLAAGARVDAADAHGKTALWYAATRDFSEAVQILLNARARVTVELLVMVAATGHSTMVAQLQAAAGLIPTGISLLLTRFAVAAHTPVACVGVAIAERLVPQLVWAAGVGRRDAVDTLVAVGASVNTAAEGGVTPLMAAAAKGRIDIVMLLLRLGADASARDAEGNSALVCGIRGGHVTVVNVLLRKVLTLADNEALLREALLCAAQGRNTDILRALAGAVAGQAWGAALLAEAVTAARESGRADVVRLLEQAVPVAAAETDEAADAADAVKAEKPTTASPVSDDVAATLATSATPAVATVSTNTLDTLNTPVETSASGSPAWLSRWSAAGLAVALGGVASLLSVYRWASAKNNA